MAALVAILAVPQMAQAEPVPRARLIDCGETTCLRIYGHRPSVADAVTVAGQELTVDGGRSWTATIPIEKARALSPGGADMLVNLVNARTGELTPQVIELPPGALGTRLSITKLIVRSH